MQNNQTQTDTKQVLKQQNELIVKEQQKYVNEKYFKNYTKEQIALIFSYLNGNNYFQNLKKQHKYLHWMSTQQKRNLLTQSYSYLAKSNIAFQIEQIHKQTALNHSFQEIKIIVMILYGKLYYQQKSYSFGQWIEVNNSLASIIQQKAVCLMFEKNLFEQKIRRLNFFHYKKMHIKKYLFQKINIQISSKKLDQIVDLVQYHTKTQKIIINHKQLKNPIAGLYILIKGSFYIYDLQNKLRIGDICEQYFGEQSFWSDNTYNLVGKQYNSQYLFCSKSTLQTCLGEVKYAQLVTKLQEIYHQKLKTRIQTQKSIHNIQTQLNNSKQKAEKRVKSKINIDECQQVLKKLKDMKPKWQKEQEAKYKKIQNKRKNIFTQLSQQQIKKRKKYFSVKLPKRHAQSVQDKQILQQKNILKKHLSQPKINGKTQPVTLLKSTRINNLMNQTSKTTDFSNFAKTSCIKQANNTARTLFVTPKRVKSQSKFQKVKQFDIDDQIDKWQVEYSKKYDRSLSWSIRKAKNLNKVVKFKNKVFPKQRTQFFTIQDAQQAMGMSFFNLQKLRREEGDEKNRRTFQKVFKQKMLIMDASRKIPLVFR